MTTHRPWPYSGSSPPGDRSFGDPTVRKSAKRGKPAFASRATASIIVTGGLRFSPASLTTVSATSCGNSRYSPHRYASRSITRTPRSAKSPDGKSARFHVIRASARAATAAAA